MKWTTIVAVVASAFLFSANAQAESWTRLNRILGVQDKPVEVAPETQIVESAPMAHEGCGCKGGKTGGCNSCRNPWKGYCGSKPCGMKVKKFSFQNNWMIGCGNGCSRIKKFSFDCNKMIGCGTCKGGYDYECGTKSSCCGKKSKGFNLYWMHGGSYKPLGTKSCGVRDTCNYLKFRLNKCLSGAAHGCCGRGGRFSKCSTGCNSCGGHDHGHHDYGHKGEIIEEHMQDTPSIPTPAPATEAAPMERAA